MSFLTKLPRDRYSKDAFAHFRGDQDGFDLGTAKAMAWMCQLAYETDEPAKVADIAASWTIAVPAGGIVSEEVATPLPKSSSQAIVATRGGAAIVTFAGTDPLVLADWITDFDVGITDTGAAAGFAVAADSVWPKIQAVLKAATPTKIFVTGHSLGGALAVLTAEKINAVLPGRVRAVYTFGMPRTGDRSFATGYNQSLGARTYRLAHGNDVVPTVAPSSLGFRHVGRYLHCARQGKFDPQALDPTPGSDLPPFLNGLAANLKDLLHGPLTNVVSDSVRINLAAAFQLGAVPAGMRTDPGGLVIELLPPPLRDHMPDRYIEAT